MNGVTKLKFRIVSCGSEDPEFPVTELLKHGPHTKGWQSARFCDYPQEVILQFSVPARIKQLQFLSHQFKVSSKIELYTFFPETPGVVPLLDNIKFKRLGYLSLDSNEQSNYQARELKSVYIDVTSLYLKLVLNKCHINKFNLFNQVGLIAVNCLGEELVEPGRPAPRSGVPDSLENELEFDATTMDRLKALASAKQRAIDNEDFDEAKRIKDAIERLKNVGYQLLQLEDRKRTAIASEDYDTAKIIKLEIERLRNAVLPPIPNQNFYAPIQSSSNRPFSGNLQPLGLGSRPSSRPQPQQSIARTDSIERTSKAATEEVEYDERVLPAMASGKPQGDEGLPLDFDRNMPEPLTAQNAKHADSLIDILGEDICRRIFSKTWQFREEGLQQIDAELQKGTSSELFGGRDNTSVFTTILGAIRHTIGDPVSQVSLRAMNLLRQLLSSLDPSRTQLSGESKEYFSHILAGLLEKAGDNNQRVRDNAEQSFLMLARSEVVGAGPATQQVLKPVRDTKASSVKHIVGRLSILNSLVKDYRIDNSTIPYQPVVDYALAGFKNSSRDVRNAAYTLLLTIYSCVGTRLEKSLVDLRPAQLEMLHNGISETFGGQAPIQEFPIIKETRESPSIKEPSQRTRPGQVSRQTEKSGARCNFCGRNDSAFKNEDNLDIHWWKDCPMLVACPLCSQVIDIITLNPHLLRECEMHDVMRECPRCREAVHIDEFEMHVEEQACLSSKPSSKANRCPLCHDDVSAGVEGWKAHILEEGCPNNDRSNL